MYFKQTTEPFPKVSTTRREDVLYMVNSDIRRLLPVKLNGGALYLATFIGDKSRWTEVYFLKKKTDVKEAFMKYKAKVENQRQYSTPYTPKQNGPRALLDKMPHKIWYKRKPVVTHFRIFVGYSNESIAYRIWDPTTRKDVLSRDVKFVKPVENKCIMDNQSIIFTFPDNTLEFQI